MAEESLTNLPVTENNDHDSESVRIASNNVSTKSQKCAIEDSGRIMFWGENMLYLTINGIQMFTFFEIFTKICPDIKRGKKKVA